MIFKLRLLSDENDNFVRDIEVPHTMTLTELHDFIVEMLEYDNCMASFFACDSKWNKKMEYTLMEMGMDSVTGEEVAQSMDKATVADMILSGFNNIIWQFDIISERAYYIQIVSKIDENPDFAYPRVSFENAPTPDQYDPDAVDPEEGSIFDEMMDDYGGTYTDDNSADEW